MISKVQAIQACTQVVNWVHWESSTFLGFNPLFLFVRVSKVVPWLLLAIANRSLDLVQPMRGVHEKSHANHVGYLSPCTTSQAKIRFAWDFSCTPLIGQARACISHALLSLAGLHALLSLAELDHAFLSLAELHALLSLVKLDHASYWLEQIKAPIGYCQ